MTEHKYQECRAVEDSDYSFEAIEQREREEMSKNAHITFVKASVLEPASVTAQGAIIASLFQKAGLRDPLLSGMCLLDDADKIKRLVSKANSIHAVHNKAVRVTDEQMRGIIKRDFFVAERFKDFSPEDIQYILTELKLDVKKKKLSEDSFFTKALEVPTHGRPKLPDTLGRIVIDLVK